MASKQKKGRGNKRQEKAAEYNGWRALVVFLEGIFDLINNRQIYPAFGLVLLSICVVVVVRLPENELAEVIKLLISKAGGSAGGMFALLIVTNGGWWYLTKRLRSIYKHEIERLVAVRSELMHGPDAKIRQHRSSEEDCPEQYLMPTNPAKAADE
ncbi:hypothetical protein [Abyssibacter profundi]|uniref:Uncharacterized protein n=1 Tax=Abyssibacter profundi TaxID=2182787 RepID=A0A383XPQ9_9GAMM|nr:hypothetical protein [Abyssibacter profundi]PWN54613.1 hypothetical protein DEH80_16450 [Abyssibacter profundi]